MPPTMLDLRELYPAAVILESLAVEHAPRFDAVALGRLQEANARYRAAAGDPAAVAAADAEFHRRLTERCGNRRLLSLLRRMRAPLPADPPDAADVHRAAAQHEGIVAALSGGDAASAAALLREHLAGTVGVRVARLGPA